MQIHYAKKAPKLEARKREPSHESIEEERKAEPEPKPESESEPELEMRPESEPEVEPKQIEEVKAEPQEREVETIKDEPKAVKYEDVESPEEDDIENVPMHEEVVIERAETKKRPEENVTARNIEELKEDKPVEEPYKIVSKTGEADGIGSVWCL